MLGGAQGARAVAEGGEGLRPYPGHPGLRAEGSQFVLEARAAVGVEMRGDLLELQHRRLAALRG
jgi:hypothetical protein